MINIKVKCIPIKELYCDSIHDYRVVSCSLIDTDEYLKLNKYGNFTISGSNISSLKLNQEANLILASDTNSKYEASYIMLGYVGVNCEQGAVNIAPEFELEILSRLMDENQAINVNKAYPRFVNMVLNGQEEQIDHKKIYNVGKVRLPEYIKKVKGDCENILFYPIAYENGITSSAQVRELANKYNTIDALRIDFFTIPYHVYMDILGFSFDKADKLVLAHHEDFINSKHRCEYACVEVLKQNELLGDTRLQVKFLVHEAKQLVLEAMEHIKEAVKNSQVIHYDEASKYVALKPTYEAERTIASHILKRLNDKIPEFLPMNWTKFKEVDGVQFTEEQIKILKIVGEGARIALLTGSAGCGKSFSTKAVIRMLEENGRTYKLLAPTGIASRRLRESTGRKASTIHMFLAGGLDNETYDYIIIDEFSMVSVHLLASLLDRIEYNPNLIFVCDEAQLASISCGNVLQDIINSNIVPRANLTKPFRYGTSGLITIATDTRNGQADNLLAKFDDFEFIEIENDAVSQVVEQYESMLQQGFKKDEILILSPYNRGNKGTYVINKKIQAEYNPHEYSSIKYKHPLGEIQFKVGDRVLNTKNDYHMPCIEFDEDGYESYGVMFCANGDIGTVRECRKNFEGQDELVIEFDNKIAAVSGSAIQNLILGYAVSVHKIQGAQSRGIIALVAPEHSRMISRNLLYVEFSRSQEKMVVIGDIETIKEGLEVQENMERDTFLEDMLNEQV